MARTNGASLDSIDEVEDQLKDVIQGLYQVMVQVSQYDNAGHGSRDVVADELRTLSSTLRGIHDLAASPARCRLPHVPVELIAYVENGRNPDIYTREFVEMLRRGNQLMRGKIRAFESFRDILADEMRAAMPEAREDVDRVLAATTAGPAPSSSSAAGPASSASAAPPTRQQQQEQQQQQAQSQQQQQQQQTT